MTEKKSVKFNISTPLLILTLIIIAFMTYYIYTEKANATKEIETLESNATKLQNTIKHLQDEINTISNTINSNYSDTNNNILNNNTIHNNAINNNTSNNNTSFTDEQVKTAIYNYLELSGHRDCNGLLNILTTKGDLNHDISKDIETTVDGMFGYYITNIKYSDYRNAMLKYVSRNEFERNWNSYYLEDSNGNLLSSDGGGSLCIYSIKEIIKINDSTYSAKATPIIDDIEQLEEVYFTCVIASNNGVCIIDYLN